MNKKLNIKIHILVLIVFCMVISVNIVQATTDMLKITSGSAILIEPKSGRVIYEKNADKRVKIASVTKLMTGIVALENAKSTDLVSISKNAALIGGSCVGLKSGSEVTLDSLLYGMFLESGNDCAIAVAEHTGGTIENFVSMMNKKAYEIGAKNTRFSNPHGLDTDENYSTAKDVAIILKYAVNIKKIASVISTESINKNFAGVSKYLANTNRLLFTYKGCDGGKTGFTNIANRCLAVTAIRNNMRLICVVLGANTTDIRFNEARKLLDYGFENYTLTDISEYMNWYINIPVIKGNIKEYKRYLRSKMIVPLKQDEIEKIYVKQDLIHLITPPMSSNSYIGNIAMYIDEEKIYEEKVYLDTDIYKKRIFDYLISCYKNKFNIIEQYLF